MKSAPLHKKAILLIGSATLASLIYATQYYLYHRLQSQEPTTIRVALAEGFVDWYVWAALVPLIVWLAGKIPFSRNRWHLFLLIHIPAGLIFSLVHIVIQASLDQMFIHQHYGVNYVLQQSRNLFARTFHFGVLVYVVIVIIRNAFEYFRDQEIRSAQLEARLARAQLQTLQMQIHPHFLFNTLHAISSLISRDPKAADRMIAGLSDLLRMSLAQADLQEIPLQQELQCLNKYLEIEKMRFADRLVIEMKIDPATLDCLVPAWILQPLAENCIRHGLSRHGEKGKIEIETSLRNGLLKICVSDNGPGMRAASDPSEGIGLSNVRARLQQLYHDGQELTIQSNIERGTEVMIRVPFHTS